MPYTPNVRKINMRNYIRLLLLVLFCNLQVNLGAQENATVEISGFKLNMQQQAGKSYMTFEEAGVNGTARIKINGEDIFLLFENGRAQHAFEATEKGQLIILETSKGNQNFHQLYHISARSQGQYRVKTHPRLAGHCAAIGGNTTRFDFPGKSSYRCSSAFGRVPSLPGACDSGLFSVVSWRSFKNTSSRPSMTMATCPSLSFPC